MAQVHEDDKPHIPVLSQLLDGSAPLKLEYRVVRADDQRERWVLRQGVLDRDEAGRPVRLIGTIQDITPERNATSRLTTLLAVGDALRMATTRSQALTESCRLLGQRLEVQRVGFAAITVRDELFTVDQGWCAPEMPVVSGEFSFKAFRRTSDFCAAEPSSFWTISPARPGCARSVRPVVQCRSRRRLSSRKWIMAN